MNENPVHVMELASLPQSQVQLMTPEDVANYLNQPVHRIFLQVKCGHLPPPDVVLGSGPRAVRRWYPATIFGWRGNAARKEDVA